MTKTLQKLKLRTMSETNFYNHYNFLQACMIRYKALGKKEELDNLKFLYKKKLQAKMKKLYGYDRTPTKT